MSGGNAISQVHFEPGEVVFHQGDLGDSLYIILEGEADVVVESDENGQHEEKIVATLKEGEYFGEMALLNQRTRSATIRCKKAMNLLALRQGDFRALVANLPELREGFEEVMQQRIAMDSEKPEPVEAG